jgi:hypothetical protein
MPWLSLSPSLLSRVVFRFSLSFDPTGNVPTKNKTNKALGRWVSTQRSNYKKYCKGEGTLRPKTENDEMDRRIRMLNAIGFNWSLLPGSGASEEGSENHSDETEEVKEQDEEEDDEEQEEHQANDMDRHYDGHRDDDHDAGMPPLVSRSAQV